MESFPEPDDLERKPAGPAPDSPWPVVEAIGPDEDVLSRLRAEDEAGRPLAVGQPMPRQGSARSPRRWLALLAVGVLVCLATGAWYLYAPARSQAPPGGTLSIETRPPAALVTIDGKLQGTSPLTVSLPPGRHTVELAGTSKREIAVTIEAGTRTFQYIEMPEGAQPGRVHVETTPAGAQVAIDGTLRGVAPIDVEGLEPGPHTVVLRLGGAIVTQIVTVRPGTPVSLIVPMAAADVAQPGFVTVASPVELQVLEGERLIGTSRAGQILLAPGRHELRLVNKEMGFDSTRPVQIAPGRTSTVKIDLPNGALFVNAVPWAEVFVDGAKIGETPIANYLLPLGPHEIVLRNPRFAEQRRTVVVSLTAPVRIGVDLRQ